MSNQVGGDSFTIKNCNRFMADDAGQDFVTANCIGHSSDRGSSNGRVLIEHAFDFHRGNIFTTAANDVLAPIDKVQHALRVARHDVAGVKPTVGPGLIGGGLVFEITRKKSKARIVAGMAYQQFAWLIDSRRCTCVIDEPYLYLRRFTSKATGAYQTRLLIGDDDCAIAGLGHRPSFQQGKAKALLERRL